MTRKPRVDVLAAVVMTTVVVASLERLVVELVSYVTFVMELVVLSAGSGAWLVRALMGMVVIRVNTARDGGRTT